MPLFKDGQRTTAQKGDLICIDTYHLVVSIERDGSPLIQQDGSEFYCVIPQDGVQIETLVELVADACGLEYEEVQSENSDKVCYRFK